MFYLHRSVVRRFLVALALTIGLPAVSSANWLLVKNDTGKTITVQEIVMVNGQAKRGKTTNLLPGETYREFLAIPGMKKVDVFDAKAPNQAVWSGSLNCKDETQTFSVTQAAGKFGVAQVANPAKKRSPDLPP